MRKKRRRRGRKKRRTKEGRGERRRRTKRRRKSLYTFPHLPIARSCGKYWYVIREGVSGPVFIRFADTCISIGIYQIF